MIHVLGTFDKGADAIAAAKKMLDLAPSQNLSSTEKDLLNHLAITMVNRPEGEDGWIFELGVHMRRTRRGTVMWAAPGHPIYPDAADKRKEVV